MAASSLPPVPISVASADGRLIGSSPAMQRVVQSVQRIGPTDAPVLSSGASGIGKGLVARALHCWRRGFDPKGDAYAVTAQHPGFIAFLRATGVRTVSVCGLAANICCFYTARDLRQQGFTVCLVEDASAGVDVAGGPPSQAQAKAEGQRLGIRYVKTHEICQNKPGFREAVP